MKLRADCVPGGTGAAARLHHVPSGQGITVPFLSTFLSCTQMSHRLLKREAVSDSGCGFLSPSSLTSRVPTRRLVFLHARHWFLAPWPHLAQALMAQIIWGLLRTPLQSTLPAHNWSVGSASQVRQSTLAPNPAGPMVFLRSLPMTHPLMSLLSLDTSRKIHVVQHSLDFPSSLSPQGASQLHVCLFTIVYMRMEKAASHWERSFLG